MYNTLYKYIVQVVFEPASVVKFLALALPYYKITVSRLVFHKDNQ